MTATAKVSARRGRNRQTEAATNPPLRIEPMPFDKAEAMKGLGGYSFYSVACELYAIYIQRHKGPRTGYVSGWYLTKGPRQPRLFTKEEADSYLEVFNAHSHDIATAWAVRVPCFTMAIPPQSPRDQAEKELNRIGK